VASEDWLKDLSRQLMFAIAVSTLPRSVSGSGA
jgi:hypothetical protein